jgi:tetratricopeptide (TPR) repeat protein
LPAQPIVPSLTRARAALQQEKIQEAVATYRALLHQDYRIEKIILDLNRAVGRYPLEAALWETLGEAYNQAGQLQQALEAYSKAIECFNRIKNT